MANSKTILRNTLWFALENVISFGSSLITSIAIARTLGPSRMGYIIYVLWIVNIASTLGGVGIPATTRKYMAELLGAERTTAARYVYRRTLWLQAAMATFATLVCSIWVLHDSPVDYRLPALLLIFSIWPSMVNSVSALANVAREDLSANLPASVSATVCFFVLTMMTIGFHWGVIGVAASMLAMRTVDFAVRIVPTYRRIEAFKPASPSLEDVPQDLPQRMRSFAAQSVAGMLLTLIVWDRSEIVLLKHFSADIRQVAFYSVAFSLAERLLVFPTVFASATGASMLAQYGRDRSRLPALTAASARYLGLTSIPLHIIATALAGAALLTLYGNKYTGAVAVTMAAPLLCAAKAFLTPVQTMLETVERQSFFIYGTLVASAIDVAIAALLIPHYGALGAAIGSGIAQILCVSFLWWIAIEKFEVQLPWRFFSKTTIISTVAAVAAYAVVRFTPPVVGLAAGSAVAIVVFLALAGWARVFEKQDIDRFAVLVKSCPAALAAPVALTFSWLNRRTEGVQTEELI